jgi:hypothetical protein
MLPSQAPRGHNQPTFWTAHLAAHRSGRSDQRLYLWSDLMLDPLRQGASAVLNPATDSPPEVATTDRQPLRYHRRQNNCQQARSTPQTSLPTGCAAVRRISPGGRAELDAQRQLPVTHYAAAAFDSRRRSWRIGRDRTPQLQQTGSPQHHRKTTGEFHSGYDIVCASALPRRSACGFAAVNAQHGRRRPLLVYGRRNASILFVEPIRRLASRLPYWLPIARRPAVRFTSVRHCAGGEVFSARAQRLSPRRCISSRGLAREFAFFATSRSINW